MDGVRVGWYRFEWCRRVGGVLVGRKDFVGRLELSGGEEGLVGGLEPAIKVDEDDSPGMR